MNYLEQRQEQKITGIVPPKKKKKRYISRYAEKRKVQNEKYHAKREHYLARHKLCECGCGREAVQIHHKKGRMGNLLYDKRFFMAVADICHKKIEANPTWATQQGFTISRHKKTAA